MTTRLQLTCSMCDTPLENGLDTFGDIGNEVCQDCWIRLPETMAQEKQETHGVVIFEFAADGKTVKSITYKIVEDDDDLFDDDPFDDDPVTHYCDECDKECDQDGVWNGIYLFYCHSCGTQYEVTP